ncbi:MAG: aminotransferase class V-fold PLP-dependent enzyme [Clostridia bacterium]|nr:aminotransferase class V-fold PLP-dependent enzyme [Clostridia bacterium]
MIYLDNAATTWPKPPAVVAALMESVVRYGANPGRSGHAFAMETMQKVHEVRKKAARFFGLSDQDSDRVIFTPGCTYSLNFVIKGLLGWRDHVVVSNLEHNAVMRPVFDLAGSGVSCTVARADYGSDEQIVSSFARCLLPNTKLVVCTHASNVTGKILPIEKIGRLCKNAGVLFAVDCAQTAGLLDIDVKKMNIDFLCAPAHKGLYGTSGLGLLICGSKKCLKTIIQGGTGVLSALKEQPAQLPERLESGSLNTSGICALDAGLDFLNSFEKGVLFREETGLAAELYRLLAENKAVNLLSEMPAEGRTVPLILFNIVGQKSDETALLLDKKGIAVRAGLHCAPYAHKAAGTFPDGAVRMCLSAFTTHRDICDAAEAVGQICTAAQ